MRTGRITFGPRLIEIPAMDVDWVSRVWILDKLERLPRHHDDLADDDVVAWQDIQTVIDDITREDD